MSGDHEQLQENVAAYLLRALPEDEARVFENHLVECTECAQEADRLRVAVEALPRSVTPVEPPESLKRSLMSTVAGESRPAPAPEPRRRLRRPPVLTRLFRGLRPATALAAAALLVVTASLAGYGIAELRDAEPRTLAAQVDQARAPGASAALVATDEDARGAVLKVDGLPALEPGQVYQVWLKRGRSVVPGSLFSVDGQGHGTAGIADGLEGVDAVMVTREKRRGARVPTEAPLLQVKTT